MSYQTRAAGQTLQSSLLTRCCYEEDKTCMSGERQPRAYQISEYDRLHIIVLNKIFVIVNVVVVVVIAAAVVVAILSLN